MSVPSRFFLVLCEAGRQDSPRACDAGDAYLEGCRHIKRDQPALDQYRDFFLPTQTLCLPREVDRNTGDSLVSDLP